MDAFTQQRTVRMAPWLMKRLDQVLRFPSNCNAKASYVATHSTNTVRYKANSVLDNDACSIHANHIFL